MVLQYPYFQAARALHLKGLFNQESFRYNYELKKTAAYTTDRTILFDFITSENFITIQQEKIDAILDKIAKSGYDSLTKSEKEFLFDQSKNG